MNDFIKLIHVALCVVEESRDSLLVVTKSELLRVKIITRNSSALLVDTFWRGLYPNSIIIDKNECIYIGMRHGVAKIKKNNGVYTQSWLLPSKEIANQKFVPGIK